MTQGSPWNGIPDDPDQSGWHWFARENWMKPFHWSAPDHAWGSSIDPDYEYLGPCTPPVSRCRDGRRKIAVSVRRIFDLDEIAITMNDGSTHSLDSYYWHNGAPVFEIIGKTIPEIDKAAAACRSLNQEDAAE